MITQSHCLLFNLIEGKMRKPRYCLVTKRECGCQEGCLKMAKAPTKVLKGIPIGNFDAIADQMGNMKIKPKRKPAPPHAQYAAKNRKRFKSVSK